MVKHFFRILYGCIALSVLAGFYINLFLHPHHYFFWENLPIFSALFGFFGCVVIILGSKVLGHWWLQKKEDYYDKPEPPRRNDP